MLHLYHLPFTEIEFVGSEYLENKLRIFSLYLKLLMLLAQVMMSALIISGWPEATVLIRCFIPTIKEFGVWRKEEKGKLQFYPRPLRHIMVFVCMLILSDRLSKGFVITYNLLCYIISYSCPYLISNNTFYT